MLMTQIYGFCHPHETDVLQLRLSACIDDVSLWTSSIQRKPRSSGHSLVCVCSASAAGCSWSSAYQRHSSVSRQQQSATLEFTLTVDADMSMTAHVTATVRSCFAALRQIRSVHHSLSRDALVALIRALVVTKLDYCCSVMVGVSGTLLRQLQSVLNAAARLVFSARRSTT